MTKVEIDIKEAVEEEEDNRKNGCYVGTFAKLHDRLMIYDDDRLIGILNLEDDLWIQEPQSIHYKDVQKIKKIKMEIELE